LLSLNLDQLAAVKFLYGFHDNGNATDGASEENINYMNKLTFLLSSKIEDDEYVVDYDVKAALYQVNYFEIYISSFLSPQ
ncbi:hypothetical protein OFM39_34610, partial [Escherichia coli]|nr:hypothetical protein [Escherichia coli]